MRGSRRALTGLLLLAPTAWSQPGFPFTDEDLRFNVVWPSGLSLGESRMLARRIPTDRWEFELSLEASVPGLMVRDRYRSIANRSLCSLELEKEATHGPRKWRETTDFDQQKSEAVRKTSNGGKSEFTVPSCAQDALTFLYLTRRELGQGRVPPPQTVFFGAAYHVSLEYTGLRVVDVDEKPRQADRLVASVRGPSSDLILELFFARDPARTPLVVRVPFSLGVFSLELVR